MTEIPIGYVGVVVSYVGDEHVDVSGDALHARRPGRARPQGRVGRAAAARQAPAQHARHEGRAGADDQHRPQLGAAHRGAPLRRAAVADHRALEGRLRVHPRRVADHPHRHEERAAGDLARRLDAEPGRPRAAADGRQLLPQLGAAGDRARVPVGAQRRASSEAFDAHQAARSRPTTSSASTR